MSEYQYYEFQTADRRLSEKEMEQLRSYSTRAVITPTSFSNEYSFGSFKGNPNAWMEKYFDGFVYLANWGSHELQLALPANRLSAKTARLYCAGEAASMRQKSGNLILTFRSEEESGGEWVQGEGMLSSLLPLRAELARGDLRSLYVGWLLNVQAGELEEEDAEPPVPPNLGESSGPLSKLVDFLRIDRDLLAVAAEANPRKETQPGKREEIAAWVAQFPAKERDKLLVRLIAEDDLSIGAKLRPRFNRDRAGRSPVPRAPRRTVGELLAAAEAFSEQRMGREARREAKEKGRQEHLAAIARQKHLDALAGREPELWTKIAKLVATKLPKRYDLAVQHLLDLRDLAAGTGAEADFSRRVAVLREAHARKPSFIGRLQDKGLG
jgi:hypothetical protein